MQGHQNGSSVRQYSSSLPRFVSAPTVVTCSSTDAWPERVTRGKTLTHTLVMRNPQYAIMPPSPDCSHDALHFFTASRLGNRNWHLESRTHQTTNSTNHMQKSIPIRRRAYGWITHIYAVMNFVAAIWYTAMGQSYRGIGTRPQVLRNTANHSRIVNNLLWERSNYFQDSNWLTIEDFLHFGGYYASRGFLSFWHALGPPQILAYQSVFMCIWR